MNVRDDPVFVSTMFREKANSGFVFIEAVTEQRILTTPYIVLLAENEINHLLNAEGRATLNEFLLYLGAKEEQLAESDIQGWSIDCLGQNGYYWLDFNHLVVEEDDGNIAFLIKYECWPCENMMSCFDYGDVAC